MSSYACNSNVRETGFYTLVTALYHTMHLTPSRKEFPRHWDLIPNQPDLPRAASTAKVAGVSLHRNAFKTMA